MVTKTSCAIKILSNIQSQFSYAQNLHRHYLKSGLNEAVIIVRRLIESHTIVINKLSCLLQTSIA